MIGLMTLIQCAAIDGRVVTQRDKKAGGWIKEQSGVIEIKNKSDHGINVVVLNDGKVFAKDIVIPPATEYLKKIIPNEDLVPVARFVGEDTVKLDPSKQVLIKIGTLERIMEKGLPVLAVSKYTVYEIKPGNWKIIAVSYEKNKLSPQKGKGGKTNSGIALKDNIKKIDDQSEQILGKKYIISDEDSIKSKIRKEFSLKEIPDDLQLVP